MNQTRHSCTGEEYELAPSCFKVGMSDSEDEQSEEEQSEDEQSEDEQSEDEQSEDG